MTADFNKSFFYRGAGGRGQTKQFPNPIFSRGDGVVLPSNSQY